MKVRNQNFNWIEQRTEKRELESCMKVRIGAGEYHLVQKCLPVQSAFLKKQLKIILR